MNTQNESLFRLVGTMLKSKDVIVFSFLSLVFFVISTYFYNVKFPNHKYPEFLGILKSIAPVV
ncbi:hypothetical protein [Bacillus arachidis]|uniref:hypothetical protein n=1 Tax=Bacillus arachidis TaxID=2819290 RepID=UPI00255CD911|nr:hypothetical protein [Bacillus arachidis]WIY60727.1 hypothetical protein QRY57_23365 [Bacillus arachidis]